MSSKMPVRVPQEKDWLVQCEHEVYCQGYEFVWGYFLVRAIDFEEAKNLLRAKLRNPSDFGNMTIER